MTFTERIKKWWKNIPEKKRYIEVVTALLSIPVLATAILLNLGNLRDSNKSKDIPFQTQQGGVTVIPIELKEKNVSPTNQQCKKEVGPVEIVYPKENQTVSDNPLCIEIAQKSAEYCSVQWSLKLNDGDRSSFTDKQFCFSNVSSGQQKVQAIIKSTVSQDQTLLERNFIYQNKSGSSPTPATTSASLQGQ